MILGVDTGGTFTDFVALVNDEIKIHKVLSTPSAPEQAILQGIKELELAPLVKSGDLLIVHGTTVATNAVLEGKGAKTLYITNQGFADLLTIGRQTRKELYNLKPKQKQPPIPKHLCLEVNTRVSADGKTLEHVSDDELSSLTKRVKELDIEAVAINFLFSYLNAEDEKRVEQALPKHLFVCRSSQVLPEYREYERGIATWLNAWLGPLMHRYIGSLQQQLSPSPVTIMQSSGGTIAAEQAAHRAVNLLLSGPAGGLSGAKFMADNIDISKILTFDMGGTSTDVALIEQELQLTNEGRIGDYPVAIPMVDMHTIGAGGGSIAYIDQGGMLQVGPESAGADPGPACYGKQQTTATVTDANTVLGRLRPEAFLGGTMQLNREAAKNAIQILASKLSLGLEETAEGILNLANEHMSQALRAISVQRGYDPKNFKLVCFGGAGGLHVCALAESLQMHQVFVPPLGGVLSAFGMLVAPRERQLSRTLRRNLDQINMAEIEQAFSEMAEQGIAEMIKEGITATDITQFASLDLRYSGQSFTLNVAWSDIHQIAINFQQQHLQRYGHALSIPIELVNIRLGLRAPGQTIKLPQITNHRDASPSQSVSLPGIGNTVIYRREELATKQTIIGPALITEQVSTTLVAPSWVAHVDGHGGLHLALQN